jgi:hypothetical protein
VTREWRDHRHRFDHFISPLVLDEASRGNPDAAARRLAALERFAVLEPTQTVAIATVHRMDYLLTWNCRHIDNAEAKPLIRSVCAVHGYVCPEICTPEELMGGISDEG